MRESLNPIQYASRGMHNDEHDDFIKEDDDEDLEDEGVQQEEEPMGFDEQYERMIKRQLGGML